MKLSQKYFDFDAEINESIPYMDTNSIRLEISSGKITSMGGHRTTWNTIFALYKVKATHEAAVLDMKNIYNILHPEVEGVKKMLKANSDITLTGTDYLTMHIHEDVDPRHHVPKPTISPANSVTETTHLSNKFFTFNPAEGEEHKKALPVDVKKVGRKIAYTNIGEPLPPPAAYTLLDAIGTSSYTIISDVLNAHKKGYLITWYLNARGEAGPESSPFPFDVI